ncbi:MAG: hypothetical protein WCL32_22440, partial [Planctomycetota bacterium]
KTEEPGERRRASSAMGKSGAEKRKDRPSQAERQGQEDLREDSEEIFHNGLRRQTQAGSLALSSCQKRFTSKLPMSA